MCQRYLSHEVKISDIFRGTQGDKKKSKDAFSFFFTFFTFWFFVELTSKILLFDCTKTKRNVAFIEHLISDITHRQTRIMYAGGA